MNPDSQLGSGIPVNFTKGLDTGIVFGKIAFNSSELPMLSEALRFIISCKPVGVKCSLLSTSSTILLNSSKSARFWLIKGYLSKNGIITLTKSLRELTCQLFWSEASQHRNISDSKLSCYSFQYYDLGLILF